jgi:hypothetical protein
MITLEYKGIPYYHNPWFGGYTNQGEGSGHSGSEITLEAQATIAQGFAAAEIGEGAASG